MSLRLPSRVFVSDVSALEFDVSTTRNGRCNRRTCPREVVWPIREGAFQLYEPRALIRRTGGGTALRGSSSRVRGSRLVSGGRRSITTWRVCEESRAETVNCFDKKTADCHVSQAGTPLSAIRCNADSSDKGKEEIAWANESVTTASSALSEWRSARTRSGQALVDWGRYHLQVMFVDRSHRARSRLAEGLFERIAAWNGFGLILYGHSCGISVIEGELPSMSYQGEGQRLGVARHVFKAPATTLDRSDLDSYDLIVAMDIEVRDEVLRMAGSKSSNGNDYANKVRLISEFVSYGTISLLEDNLLEIIQPDLPQVLTALEVQVTYMSQYSKWRMMVATITMCCAGLIQFLMDAYPDDLPDYDPVD